jgi:TRAP-type C4-dicarboxylate transport system substrate-binding protein
MTGRIAVLMAAAIALGLPAAGQAEPLQLRFASPSPAMSPITVGSIQPWAKEVNEALPGVVTIQVFAGPAVASFNNVYDRVVNQVVDAGFAIMGGIGLNVPRTTVVSLPFEEQDTFNESIALWRMYKAGVLGDEYKTVHPLTLWTFPGGAIHSNKRIRNLAEVKGQKLATGTKMIGDMLELLGAVPISTQPTDFYTSVQRGLADGVTIGWAQVTTFKLDEVTKYHLDVSLGSVPAMTFMNHAAWEKLPDKAKETIEKMSGEPWSRRMGAITARPPGELPGHEIITLSNDEVALWKARLKPITDEWVKATPDGAKVLAAYRAELAKLRDERAKGLIVKN